MYLSRLYLDLTHPSTQRALADCHDMHRNLMRALPRRESDALRAEESLLYRIVTVQDRPALFVTSQSLPDWSQVPGVRLWQDAPSVDIQALRPKLTVGRRLRFNLLAAPFKKERRESKLSARVFLRAQEERRDWLMRKAEEHGFQVPHFEEKGQQHIHGKRQGTTIDYTAVVFEGELEIVNADAFWLAYTGGIGPGKPYGLGMLMIGKV